MTPKAPFQRSLWRFFARELTDLVQRQSPASGRRRRKRHQPLALEQLEARTLLSVTYVPDPANPGKNIVTFNEDIANTSDNLTLQLNTAGQLQYNLTGPSF